MSLFIENKYTKIYMNLVLRGQKRGKLKGNVKHHIIPECFFITRKRNPKNPGWIEGNSEDPTNLVYLSHKEHLLCHMLLTKITTGIAKKKMESAIYYMTRIYYSQGKITLRTYEQYKRTPESFTDLWKKNISISKMGKPSWNKGIPRTDDEKNKMKLGHAKRRESDPNSYKQPPCSIEKAQKIKQSNTGKKWVHNMSGERLNVSPVDYEILIKEGWFPGIGKRNITVIECVHCKKKIDKANFNKWHGGNCKFKN